MTAGRGSGKGSSNGSGSGVTSSISSVTEEVYVLASAPLAPGTLRNSFTAGVLTLLVARDPAVATASGVDGAAKYTTRSRKRKPLYSRRHLISNLLIGRGTTAHRGLGLSPRSRCASKNPAAMFSCRESKRQHKRSRCINLDVWAFVLHNENSVPCIVIVLILYIDVRHLLICRERQRARSRGSATTTRRHGWENRKTVTGAPVTLCSTRRVGDEQRSLLQRLEGLD